MGESGGALWCQLPRVGCAGVRWACRGYAVRDAHGAGTDGCRCADVACSARPHVCAVSWSHILVREGRSPGVCWCVCNSPSANLTTGCVPRDAVVAVRSPRTRCAVQSVLFASFLRFPSFPDPGCLSYFRSALFKPLAC